MGIHRLQHKYECITNPAKPVLFRDKTVLPTVVFDTFDAVFPIPTFLRTDHQPDASAPDSPECSQRPELLLQPAFRLRLLLCQDTLCLIPEELSQQPFRTQSVYSLRPYTCLVHDYSVIHPLFIKSVRSKMHYP